MRSMPSSRNILLSCAFLAAWVLVGTPTLAATDTGECPAASVDLGTSLDQILNPEAVPASSCPAFCSDNYDCELACPGAGAFCQGYVCETEPCDPQTDPGCNPDPSCNECNQFCSDHSDCDSCPSAGECSYFCNSSYQCQKV